MGQTTAGYFWHPDFAKYDAGNTSFPGVEPWPAPDLPETRTRIDRLIRDSGLMDHMVECPVGMASMETIAAVHHQDYLDHLARLSAGAGGLAGPWVHMPPGGLEIARRAAGAAVGAVDAVLSGQVDTAYALVRPAGHHATPASGMGFCLLNNTAIAARHAVQAHGVARVAIIDWDVHHGNGTQDVFWDDPAVLAISIHQSRLFGSGGTPSEIGGPGAEGTVLNAPLPPGCGHGAYLATMERLVLPALERFRPGLILIASGLDAMHRDPLGRMMLYSDSYREMTALVVARAAAIGARVVIVHEGGYAPVLVPYGAAAQLEALMGLPRLVEDPFLPGARKLDGHEVTHDQDLAIRAAEVNVDKVPDYR